jgi:hypothetical protein
LIKTRLRLRQNFTKLCDLFHAAKIALSAISQPDL